MNISVNSSDTLTLTSKPKQALQKPAQASKEKKPKVQESTEPVAKVQTESTQDKKKIHRQKKSDTSQSPSSTEAHHFKKPKKRKQSEVAVNAEEKLEVPKKRKKGNAIQRSVGPAAKSPERTEATPSKEQDSKDFFASLKLEAQSCEEGSQKKKLKLQKKGTVQISEKTPSLENPSSAEKPSKKKKRNAETHPDAEGKVKPTKRKPEKKTAVSATDEKKKSKSQKFMVPSRQSADGGTKAETTVTSEDKHGSPHRQNTAPKSNTQDSKKARGTSRVVPSPSNEAKAKVPYPERKELSGKRSSSTISADRDQFVPDNDVPHDVLELNDEEDVLPMLSETKAAIVSTDDVIEGGGDDSDCLDLDLEEDIPIPCLQQVMGVKGKGQSDDDGADSDPLEMAED
ncbi:hypothetical protein BaRGS_00015013 [Batillaria attramentaria]|uniref:Uncharacterized protein n=1 Tax=Batillaria attramentaria TaxID=370345 RepID=A0ABD0L2R5_9CAEN